MIAHALKKLPDEHGDFKDICKVIEQDFFEQLNWKLESDLRKTPVWKSSVRKILYSNARFRHNLPAAGQEHLHVLGLRAINWGLSFSSTHPYSSYGARCDGAWDGARTRVDAFFRASVLQPLAAR